MGSCQNEADIVRRLTWTTYWVDDDGRNQYPRDDNWLTDGYGDYIRHVLRAMASKAELAPADQNHLLRTSSVVQHIEYAADRITYTKFDPHSSERFKLGAAIPKSVTGGTMQWDSATRILTVNSACNNVTVFLGK
jgi:hypothetical protein